MNCPYCDHEENKVVDKRETEGHEVTRRRRECLKCKKRFTTYERIELEIRVVKKNGNVEQFDREKLKRGVVKACEKRPITNEQIDAVITNIENKLRELGKNEVKSSIIGELVIKKLKALDQIAYIRFASVYRDFADVASFQKELRKILKNR